MDPAFFSLCQGSFHIIFAATRSSAKPMTILFVDIDGVLNTRNHLRRQKAAKWILHQTGLVPRGRE
jgi:hypothetical protein